MPASKTLDRRRFLIGSTAIVGGVAFGILPEIETAHGSSSVKADTKRVLLTPYVKINAQGITLLLPRADSGQGAYSMQAHLIAEELDVDPHAVTIEFGQQEEFAQHNDSTMIDRLSRQATSEKQPGKHRANFRAAQVKSEILSATTGCRMVADTFEQLRYAGASARETLKQAAAEQYNINRAALTTDNGHVVLPDGKKLPYESLAFCASTLNAVTKVSLRSPDHWKYLGNRDSTRIDMQRKCTGTEQYGIDVQLPDMLYACVKTNPVINGGVSSFDATAASTMRGVMGVMPITGGVAVIADNTWRAMQAVNCIDMVFQTDSPPNPQDALWKSIEESFDTQPVLRTGTGDVDRVLKKATTNIEAEYRVPYLAHAPMEPMNATVLYTDEQCQIWTGTQVPGSIQSQVAQLTGLSKDDIHVIVQPMGGSFGRRLEYACVTQAVEIAVANKGTPIKMTWSREEDMTHDYPRPAQIARMRGLISGNKIAAFDMKVAGQSVAASRMNREPALASSKAQNSAIAACSWDQPLSIPNYRTTSYRAKETVPVSAWRSGTNSAVGFMHNAFLDELFAQASVDPMDELIKLCTDELACQVLENIKQLSGWNGRHISDSQARGVSFTYSAGVPIAEVVEISKTDKGIKIDRVFISCDAGTVLDPLNLEAQLVGGALWGLGHAMQCEFTYDNQRPLQTNFHAFEAIRMYQAPEVIVSVLENSDVVHGIGEQAVPPAAAALANAVYALTGERIRELPLNKSITFI